MYQLLMHLAVNNVKLNHHPYQYSLTPCSSATRSSCSVSLLDEVGSSSIVKIHYSSPSGLLHELPPHSSSPNIAGTSYVSPNFDYVSWKASVLCSNLMGQTLPTSSITWWCRNEWMYEDVSVTVRISCPYSCLLLIMPSARLVWKRMIISNFDVWCSMMKNTPLRILATDTYCVIPLLLRIGTAQGSTDICLSLVQIQRIYIYLLLSHHHSGSCDLVLLITLFSSQTLEQRHLSTSFILSISWDLLWVTAGPRWTTNDGKLQPLWFQGPLIPAHVAMEDGRLHSDKDMTSSESKILSLFILDAE